MDCYQLISFSHLPHSALPLVIRLWLEEHSDDFHDPPHFQALCLLCAHLRHRLCFRRLVQTAEALLKRFQEQGRVDRITVIM